MKRMGPETPFFRNLYCGSSTPRPDEQLLSKEPTKIGFVTPKEIFNALNNGEISQREARSSFTSLRTHR